MSNELHPRIETRDENGPNGWLVPIWHVDSDVKIEQVYLTVVMPGAKKGPHLHMRRCGRFTCIKGNVVIISKQIPGISIYRHDKTGENHHFATIEVPPGTPAMIVNEGDEPAYVLNMPTPPWRPDDQDEWPVEDWDYAPTP